jgi:iron only hydrogenase large subunit-like protein
MNSIIRFREADCKNCYKCLRSCPVKAISFTGAAQAQVIDKACILCGACMSVCPQNAKIVRDDIDRIRQWIVRREKVYVSLAPSWISGFAHADPLKMTALLKRLGFTHVEETAVGAAEVSREYTRLLKARSMPTSSPQPVPTVVSLVEKHYPDLIGFLAPVVSPMVAHARMLRATYGPESAWCSSARASPKGGGIRCDSCRGRGCRLTFEELETWLHAEGLDPDATNPEVSEPDVSP